jgi:hypothetical protein
MPKGERGRTSPWFIRNHWPDAKHSQPTDSERSEPILR